MKFLSVPRKKWLLSSFMFASCPIWKNLVLLSAYFGERKSLFCSQALCEQLRTCVKKTQGEGKEQGIFSRRFHFYTGKKNRACVHRKQGPVSDFYTGQDAEPSPNPDGYQFWIGTGNVRPRFFTLFKPWRKLRSHFLTQLSWPLRIFAKNRNFA